MAILDMPACPSIDDIDWSFTVPAQENKSEWTRGSQIILLAGSAFYEAGFAIPPIVDEANFLAWSAFLAKLKGKVNSFRLPRVSSPQHALADNLVVFGAGQGGFSLTVKSPTLVSRTLLKAGQFITLDFTGQREDQQLLWLEQDLVLNAQGEGVATFNNWMRLRPLNGARVYTVKPWAVMRFKEPKQLVSITNKRVYNAPVDCEESFPSLPATAP